MIKNIIFDVGEVLIGYRWKEMLMDYGLTMAEADKVGTLIFTNELWKSLDDATMTIDDVISAYQNQYPEYSDVLGWFISHGEYMHISKPDVWHMVSRLKEKGYKIYLLSNYSEDLFNKHTKDASFMNDIDGRVVSYEIHISKPDKRIYQYLLEKYSLNAQESIFYDDRLENTKAAKALGINSVNVTSDEQLLQELGKLV